MTIKTIVIEKRAPRNAHERRLFAETETDGLVSHIVIYEHKNRRGLELVDTLFHEMCHSVVGLYRTKLTAAREEKLARLVGNLVSDAFKGA